MRRAAIDVAARDLDIASQGIAAGATRAVCLTAAWRTAAPSRAPDAAKQRLARRWFAAFLALAGLT